MRVKRFARSQLAVLVVTLCVSTYQLELFAADSPLVRSVHESPIKENLLQGYLYAKPGPAFPSVVW